jgi:hypothetical protein
MSNSVTAHMCLFRETECWSLAMAASRACKNVTSVPQSCRHSPSTLRNSTSTSGTPRAFSIDPTSPSPLRVVFICTRNLPINLSIPINARAASIASRNGLRGFSWIGVGRVATSCLDGWEYDSLKGRVVSDYQSIACALLVLIELMIVIFSDGLYNEIIIIYAHVRENLQDKSACDIIVGDYASRP